MPVLHAVRERPVAGGRAHRARTAIHCPRRRRRRIHPTDNRSCIPGPRREAGRVAREQHGQLLDAAQECSSGYPWDEFAVYDDAGNELRYELDEPGRLRLAAPLLREALAWLATAAEDLDAAIVGVTDEFNVE